MRFLCCLAAIAPLVFGQQQPAETPLWSTNYVLGPGDQVSLVVPALPAEFASKNFRIDGSGDLSLPVVGTIHAGGKTVQAVQNEIKQHLSPILQTPDVVLSVAEFTSQPVSILGAVTTWHSPTARP